VKTEKKYAPLLRHRKNKRIFTIFFNHIKYYVLFSTSQFSIIFGTRAETDGRPGNVTEVILQVNKCAKAARCGTSMRLLWEKCPRVHPKKTSQGMGGGSRLYPNANIIFYKRDAKIIRSRKIKHISRKTLIFIPKFNASHLIFNYFIISFIIIGYLILVSYIT